MNHKILFILFCSALLLPGVSLASTISAPTNFLAVNTGLVGWWTFDGARMIPKVIDSSGTGNHGRLIGQTSTTTVLGKMGQALRFDGSNDYVDAGSDSSLQLTSAGSLALWIKYSPQSDFAIVAGNMSFFDEVNGYALAICPAGCITSADGSIILELGTASSHVSLYTTAGYSDGQWHYVVATWDGNGANSGNIYVDGALVKTGTMTNSAVSGSNLAIGKEIVNDIYYYRGFMDDFRVYNRALTANEVAALYGYGVSKLTGVGTVKMAVTAPLDSQGTLMSGIIGHWTFDGPDMLQKVVDKSGNGNHGRIINQPATTTAPGRIGQGIRFDGFNDSINVGIIPSIDAISTLTTSQWVRPDTDKQQIIVGKFSSGAGGWEVQTRGGVNLRKLQFTTYPATNNGYTTADAIFAGKWYHVASVYDGTKATNAERLKIYVNGVSQPITFNGTIPATLVTSPASVIYGSWSGNSDFWSGVIDDAYIWNRALSEAEIQQLYHMAR